MKFIVSSSSLLKHLQQISGVINANTVLPILEDFLFGHSAFGRHQRQNQTPEALFGGNVIVDVRHTPTLIAPRVEWVTFSRQRNYRVPRMSMTKIIVEPSGMDDGALPAG